jgi:hypothetical protein
MKEKPYSEDFWKIFDKSIASAQETKLWKDSQCIIDSSFIALKSSSEVEENVFNSYNDQFTLAMYYLYSLITDSESISQ